MIGPKTLDELIGNANALGAMQASAIWALVSGVLSFYIWRIQKHHETYDSQWQGIRIEEAKGESKVADSINDLSNAVEKLAGDIARLNEQMLAIKIIIDERLKKA